VVLYTKHSRALPCLCDTVSSSSLLLHQLLLSPLCAGFLGLCLWVKRLFHLCGSCLAGFFLTIIFFFGAVSSM
jgi:hypothetical protein